jgi:hypothetical protein
LVDNLLASAVSHDGGTWEYPTGKDLRQAAVGYRSVGPVRSWPRCPLQCGTPLSAWLISGLRKKSSLLP